MTKLRIAVAVIAAVLLLVVIVQNTEAVDTRILFATITMPRAVLLMITMLVGFVIGLITALTMSSRNTKKD